MPPGPILGLMADPTGRPDWQTRLGAPGSPGSPGSPDWVPTGCRLGADWVPTGCRLGADSSARINAARLPPNR